MGSPRWLPLVVLFGLLALAYLGMWRGWRRRARKHELPPLAPVTQPSQPSQPTEVLLQADGRYIGTTTAGQWLDRVTARGLGSRSLCTVTLSAAGVDVVRRSAPFRIPAEALRGARHDRGLAGKVVPPRGLLVLTWRHGDLELDTGFRLTDPTAHEAWVRAVGELAARAG